MKLPIFILGLLLRFAKPLGLIGFGCFVGATLSADVPDPKYLNHSQAAGTDSNTGVDFPDIEEFVSPAVIEAALSSAGELTDSVRDFADRMHSTWTESTQKKITLARNSSGSDFRGIDRSLRKR